MMSVSPAQRDQSAIDLPIKKQIAKMAKMTSTSGASRVLMSFHAFWLSTLLLPTFRLSKLRLPELVSSTAITSKKHNNDR